ncbi:MAG: hypothetical protein ACYC6A_07930 [Armatimonadota bacterium]
MRLHTVLAMGLMALLAVALAVPTLAQDGRGKEKGKDRSVRGRVNVRININPQNDPNDARVFESWFGWQTRGYDAIDAETGERFNTLIYIVQDVDNNRLFVSSRSRNREMVQLTGRTKVTFEEIRLSWMPPGFNRGHRRQGGDFVASRIRPGDLVVLEGMLTGNGTLLATRVRVVGRAWGWDDDDDYTGYGQRAWGEVRQVDTRRNQVEVRSNIGYVTLELSRSGKVMYKGREYRIHNLEMGDRVVFYYWQDRGRNDRTIEAYLIVALEERHAFPRSDEHYWCDPSDNDRNGYRDRDDRDQYKDAGTWTEGSVDYIGTGERLNKLVLRVQRGRANTFYLPKSLQVIDVDGARISLQSLRDGELLRVYYTESEGDILIATKVVAR